jgi:hypothetical protein
MKSDDIPLMKMNFSFTKQFHTLQYRCGYSSGRVLPNRALPGGALRVLLGAVLALGSSCAVPVSAAQDMANADEFSVVPAGDALYRNLSVVMRAGWTSLGTNLVKSAPQGAAPAAPLTRYEMALETAKALVAVKARQEANPQWVNSVSKPAVRALQQMTQALRPELKGLGVDVAAALKLCTQLLEARAVTSPVRLPRASATTFSRPARETSPVVMRSGRENAKTVELRLSQRLLVSTAVSALQRESQDPLSDVSFGLGREAKSKAGTNVTLSLSQRFTLRAMYDQRNLTPTVLSLQPYAMSGSSLSTLGGAVDVAVRPGMTFSGSVENLASNAVGDPSWTRYSGGVGLSAWQNRLSLRANLSRLVPDNVRELPTTVGGVGLGFDVNERLSLSLLYQQLFTVSAPSKADRLVAGGLSINF